MAVPKDYVERVYAGVLGKIIGVYLGRPFEGWTYERIMAELGEVNYYVHEKLGAPLVVTDDDISGTFTFVRALADYGLDKNLTPQQIGQTWLNYLIEGRTVLWWGGMGRSTEHTAYLRLKQGVAAPRSGSIELNSQVVAEQIGAQIFIDGWALVAPGDPALAADFARRAASVSHDGEAIYGAQVVAALEAGAFAESDILKLLDTAVSFIPSDSVIYRMIADLRRWHAQEPDWHKAWALLAAGYGYDKFGGGCHMIPNHGVIILALLYGGDDFQKALMIANTSGWDTDCNSGNVGCIMGIKNGLAGIDAGPDWRGPVGDRMLLPSADGGRGISDAVRETYALANIGRARAGLPALAPKAGAKFHFELPGSVQGFAVESSPESRGTAEVENVEGHSAAGRRSLGVQFRNLAVGRTARVATPTFAGPELLKQGTAGSYAAYMSPTLYPGQTVRAAVEACRQNKTPVTCRLYIRAYGPKDDLVRTYGPEALLGPGARQEFAWHIPSTDGAPIQEVGIEIASAQRAEGRLFLDCLTWDGCPEVTFAAPEPTAKSWMMAWVSGASLFERTWDRRLEVIQNEGRGLVMQGTRDWTDYEVSATVATHMGTAAGIAARVQGLRRYYALLLCGNDTVQLVKAWDQVSVLAQAPCVRTADQPYRLTLRVDGPHLTALLDGKLVFDVRDTAGPLDGGAVALVVDEGRAFFGPVSVGPVQK
jgi:ADP-ribosylglycohydrolase